MKINRGVALIEIILGAAIITVGILAINESFTSYLRYALGNQRNVESARLMEEGLETMSFIRDYGWSTTIGRLSTSTTYYLTFTGTKWATTTTPQYVDGIFLRSINVSDIHRNASDQISTLGTYDPNVKQIIVSVSYWQGHATTTNSISEYLANIH